MNYYAISDIHGFYDEMQIALKDSGYYEDKEPKKIVVCGDIFDRGKKNWEVQAFISEMIEKGEIILIRGNHEDLLEELVRNLEKYADWIMYSAHYSNGTAQTLKDLTGFSFDDFRMRPLEVKQAYYSTVFCRKILPAMKDFYETSKYVFVHGWIPCFATGIGGEANKFEYMEDWREAARMEWDYARWYNGMLAASQGVLEPGKTIVCGHWNASYGHSREKHICEFGEGADHSAFYGKGIIAIDACTAISKKVNCVKLIDD